MDTSKNFMGRGIHFPFSIDEQTGRVKLVGEEEDIKEAIRIILGTNKGERVMHPAFGSDAQEFLFSVSNIAAITQFEWIVTEALEKYEPRIKDISVQVSLDEGDTSKIVVAVQYTVRTTNNLYNQVYPFYLLEGVRE